MRCGGNSKVVVVRGGVGGGPVRHGSIHDHGRSGPEAGMGVD